MTKDVDPVKVTAKPGRAYVHVKRPSRSAAAYNKKPASSVEADITGGSRLGSQQPKQESSTATSKNYKFKKGIFLFLSKDLEFASTVFVLMIMLEYCINS